MYLAPLDTFLKPVATVVSELVKFYSKPVDSTRKHSYKLLSTMKEMIDIIEKLEMVLIREEDITGGVENNMFTKLDADEIDLLVNKINHKIFDIEYSLREIAVQYEIYKDIADIVVLEAWIQGEQLYLIVLTEENVSVEERVRLLQGLRKEISRLRGQILKFIRENYKATERPDGRT